MSEVEEESVAAAGIRSTTGPRSCEAYVSLTRTTLLRGRIPVREACKRKVREWRHDDPNSQAEISVPSEPLASDSWLVLLRDSAARQRPRSRRTCTHARRNDFSVANRSAGDCRRGTAPRVRRTKCRDRDSRITETNEPIREYRAFAKTAAAAGLPLTISSRALGIKESRGTKDVQ
jgi:hypothetical protein